MHSLPLFFYFLPPANFLNGTPDTTKYLFCNILQNISTKSSPSTHQTDYRSVLVPQGHTCFRKTTRQIWQAHYTRQLPLCLCPRVSRWETPNRQHDPLLCGMTVHPSGLPSCGYPGCPCVEPQQAYRSGQHPRHLVKRIRITIIVFCLVFIRSDLINTSQ